MVCQTVVVLSGAVRKRMRFCLHQRKEVFVFYSIGSELTHIRCSAVMTICVESVWCDKMSRRHAKKFCLLIHFCCETGNRAAKVFGNCDCRVIVGFQHERVQKIFHIILSSGLHTKMDFWHPGCLFACNDHVVKLI